MKVFDELRKQAHAFAVASDVPMENKDIVYRNKYNELIVKECLKFVKDPWREDEMLNHFEITDEGRK